MPLCKRANGRNVLRLARQPHKLFLFIFVFVNYAGLHVGRGCNPGHCAAGRLIGRFVINNYKRNYRHLRALAGTSHLRVGSIRLNYPAPRLIKAVHVLIMRRFLAFPLCCRIIPVRECVRRQDVR